MEQPKPPEPTAASLFHAGNTCPHCQETIAAGQWIVTCPSCGSIHHETCWTNKGGCSSYHCDTAVSISAAHLHPDIVISNGELANVQVPPAAPKRTPQQVAAQFLPQQPQRASRLAIASALLAAFSLLGLVGAFARNPQLVMVGIAVALGALALGVVSMVFISNAANRLSGFPVASGGVIATVLLIIVYFVCLGSQLEGHALQFRTDLRISENQPTEEQLSKMPPAAAKAMRANVVIKCSGGFGGQSRYGSGIITRLENHKAYILTNKHVIGDGKAGSIFIVFYSGEQSNAVVERSAPGDLDIAVLTCQVLTMAKYEPLKLASTLLNAGEKVFAVGNPLGLPWTYTEGTISSLRKISAQPQDTDLYQTSTPINSGNSGGGLYTMDGVLIGVNTLTEDKSIAEALNFSIATTSILRFLDARERERFLGQ
ncbi:MAG: trypsin-like peptidase domain-containing protein [Planctomycetota bacterium]